MTAVITGSIAYDTIMVFDDHFKNHILADKVHMLSVCFLVPEMRREFGGCAGNIAYNLRKLGIEPEIMATVGRDFESYHNWLRDHKISCTHIKQIENEYTAQAFITTDLDDNQITAFHPGAMNYSQLLNVSDIADSKIGIVAPDSKQGMIKHAESFSTSNIPFIFDPGQGLPMFSGEELKTFINQATWMACNDYEWEMIKEKTGYDEKQLINLVDALIVTSGAQGSKIFTGEIVYDIPVARPDAIEDPTGCGDAYRAGLIYGLLNKADWETCGRLASLLGSLAITKHGTQNHDFDLSEINDRYHENFGHKLKI